jgi:hypothetical protein
MKYASLSDSDFDIESVGSGFDVKSVVPPQYEEDHPEQIPVNKIRSQRRLTVSILRAWVEKQSQAQRAR